VNWVALSFALSRVDDDPRVARRVSGSGRRTYHFVNLRGADDVDDRVCDWLTESYLESPI
jgi:hypothetical protein